MNKLIYTHKYNNETKAWRIIVQTQEEFTETRTLNYIKKLLKL